MEDLGERGIGLFHRVAHADGSQIFLMDVPLDPDRGDVADQEAGCTRGLDQLAGRNQLLDYHAGDGRAHHHLGVDGGALPLGRVDLLLADPHDLQRLEAVFEVGERIVVVGLRALQVLARDGLMIQQILVAVQGAPGQIQPVGRLSVDSHGAGYVGAGHIKQWAAERHRRSQVRNDAGDGAADLRDGRGRVVGVPIDRPGGPDAERPIGSLHRHDLDVAQLVGGESEEAGLGLLVSRR